MTQKHGRRYEHKLVNSLDIVTPNEVWVTSAGYSGNSTADDCDIVVTVDPQLRTRNEPLQFNIEAKKRQGESGKRISSAIGGSSTDETGVEEVKRLIEGTPSWAQPIIALKISRRKLAVIDARHLLSAVERGKYPVPTHVQEEVFDVLQPRLTPSDSISVVKPETDEWPSATSALADEIVLADALGIPLDDGKDNTTELGISHPTTTVYE